MPGAIKTIYVNSAKLGMLPHEVWELIFGILSVVGCSVLMFPFHNGITCALISAFCGTAAAVLSFLARRAGAAGGVPFALVIAAALILFGSFSRGLLCFINELITAWNTEFKTQITQFAAQASGFDSCVFFSVLLAALGILFDCLFSAKKNLIVCALMFAFTELLSLLRIQLDTWEAAYMGSYFFVIWLSASTAKAGVKNVIVAVWPVVFIVIGISMIFSSFDGSEHIDSVRERVAETAHDIRCGSDTLPKGDMREAYSMIGSDRETLRVDSPCDHDEYLAGFIGADFDGIKWNKHGSGLFADEWNGIFKWLEKKSFAAQMQYSYYNDTSVGGDEEAVTVVENTGADRSYVYVPYSLSRVTDGSYSINDDLAVMSRGIFGTRKYSFTHSGYENTEDVLIKESSANSAHPSESAELSQTRKVYSGFVASAYTELDDNVRQRLNDIFFDSDNVDGNMSLYSVISRIRSILELRVSYSDEPSRYYADKEFSDWFLNDAQSGNSAYFATVGALALRAAGYPSRYAEGYHKDIGSITTNVITEKDSHAWAEVYIEYVGWIPVEMTPGFYRTSLLSQMTVEISKDAAGGGTDDSMRYSASESYSDGEKDDNDDTEGVRSGLKRIAAWALLAVLALFAAVLIRRPALMAARAVRMRHGVFEVEIYRYIFRMLRAAGIKCDRAEPYECADEVCGRFKEIRPQEYGAMVKLMQKYTFGQQKLTEAERRTLRIFAQKLRRLLYSEGTSLKRIKYRYKDCV